MEALFLAAYELLAQATPVGAFVWGAASLLLSPCHLASVPLLTAYVSGGIERTGSREAALCSVLFGLGLWLAVGTAGLACAAAGRLLGDLPSAASLAAGLVMTSFGLETAGVLSLRLPTASLPRVRRGRAGALVLGAMFGVFSGPCTFGFLAPILAAATAKPTLLEGTVLSAAFGLGHVLPLVAAGCLAERTARLLASSRFRRASLFGRRAAGIAVALIGLGLACSSVLSF